jgi:hypothetical protein
MAERALASIDTHVVRIVDVVCVFYVHYLQHRTSQHHQILITGRLGAGASISPLLICFLVVNWAS